MSIRAAIENAFGRETRVLAGPLSQAATVSWQQEELFFEGDVYFRRLISEIDKALHSVHLEVYIFEEDELGALIVHSLKSAARRGVQVRLIVDGFGSSGRGSNFFYDLKQDGVRARVYNPMPWTYFLISGPLAWNRISRLFSKVNRRNHRKMCIIDGTVAFVGSFNVSKVHCARWMKEEAWRDCGVCVKGPDVRALRRAAEKTWRHAGFGLRKVQDALTEWRSKTDTRHPLLRLNDSRRRGRTNYRELRRRIREAAQKIWISNAYFVPEGRFLKVLAAAARNGADVRVLVPRKSDVFFIRWVSAAFYGGLLQAGVRVFEYLPAMLHAKTVIVDNWATVGSTNMNHRSLLHDLEVDIVISKLENVERLREQFTLDLKSAVEVTLEDWGKRPRWERWVGKMLVYLKHWM